MIQIKLKTTTNSNHLTIIPSVGPEEEGVSLNPKQAKGALSYDVDSNSSNTNNDGSQGISKDQSDGKIKKKHKGLRKKIGIIQ